VIRTKLRDRYGLKIPFVSAGMGFIALPSLAAAVSNADGSGQLACGAAPAAVLREMIIATRERTSRPFAVNCVIETTAFGPLTTEAHIEVCIVHRIPVMAFFWTSPPDELVRRLKEGKCDVWLQTSSIAAAARRLPPAWTLSSLRAVKPEVTTGALPVYSPCCPAWSTLSIPCRWSRPAGLRMDEEWQPRYAWARPGKRT
jgi:hypothetical protein